VNSKKKFSLFTKSFFLPVWTANKAKNSLSWAFLQKISIFPIRGGKMDCFEYERFFVKRLFLTLFAVHTGKKKIS
jgi:hypothetical protein